MLFCFVLYLAIGAKVVHYTYTKAFFNFFFFMSSLLRLRLSLCWLSVLCCSPVPLCTDWMYVGIYMCVRVYIYAIYFASYSFASKFKLSHTLKWLRKVPVHGCAAWISFSSNRNEKELWRERKQQQLCDLMVKGKYKIEYTIHLYSMYNVQCVYMNNCRCYPLTRTPLNTVTYTSTIHWQEMLYYYYFSVGKGMEIHQFDAYALCFSYVLSLITYNLRKVNMHRRQNVTCGNEKETFIDKIQSSSN